MHHLKIETVKSEFVMLPPKNVEELDKISFHSGNPAIEITEGTIHLYKNQDTIMQVKSL